jgi:hypothetical protein
MQPPEHIPYPTPVQPQEYSAGPIPIPPGEPVVEHLEESYNFVEQPKPAGEPNPIIEKIKSPFIRIAESVSPGYRQRRYLEELENKGIVEPMQQTIEETPKESLTTKMKNNLLDRFKKKSSPENGGDSE